jgi:hypothetical protein
LGPVDLTAVRHSLGRESFEVCSVLHGDDGFGLNAPRNRIDWVIAGGESGINARPCDLTWIRSVVRQCQSAGIPAFVKQMGSRPFDSDAMKAVPDSDRKMTIEEVKSPAGIFTLSMCLEASVVEITDSKGGNIEDFPPELRVREFPTTEAVHAAD